MEGFPLRQPPAATSPVHRGGWEGVRFQGEVFHDKASVLTVSHPSPDSSPRSGEGTTSAPPFSNSVWERGPGG
jgi:hypothetical protein